MIKKYLLVFSALFALIISACGAEATPTISAADIASTAMADAWIAITQTQAAMPTNTPIPPTLTFTPQPTFTFVPTQPVQPTNPPATLAVAATQGECDQPPPLEPQGALVNVDFRNESKGQVNLSLGMNSPNAKKECVTYSFSLGSGGGIVDAKVLAGCYWGYAWITGDEPSIAKTGNILLCMTDTSGIHHIVITKERIEFK